MRMLATEGISSRHSGHVGILGPALGLALAVALAGCSGNSSAHTPAPGTSPISTISTGGTPSPSPRSTLTPASTAPAEAGASDICEQPAKISAQVPGSIPTYPGAQLHISYTTTDSGGNTDGVFGYCSSASASTVASFYAQQLPAKGWGSIQTYSLGDHQQVTGTKGNSQLTMTAWPDSARSGVTNILVTVQGI